MVGGGSRLRLAALPATSGVSSGKRFTGGQPRCSIASNTATLSSRQQQSHTTIHHGCKRHAGYQHVYVLLGSTATMDQLGKHQALLSHHGQTSQDDKKTCDTVNTAAEGSGIVC